MGRITKTSGEVRNEKDGGKKKKSDWAERVIRFFNTDLSGDVPIMVRNSKDAETWDFRIVSYKRFRAASGTVVEKCGHIFKNMAEVYRAAFYIGMTIIIHWFIKADEDSGRFRGYSAYRKIRLREKYNADNIMYDDTIDEVRRIIRTFRQGRITAIEQEEQIDEMKETLPKGMHKTFWLKVKQLKAGENISNIYETKHQGVKG